MAALIPPDYKQCQCEITTRNPWVMGGPVKTTKRCDNLPAWLAVEIRPGSDGQHGSMTLCNDCAKVMMDQVDIRQNVQLQPILRGAAQ